ncbi:NirD/YgiW/YdeI family stress tolerance protein [Kordiimonas gwangyangensis]|uniref:NirD/YgiW/YdeI family stress tolerance protein n=1 Tax=Kordiimonas gwangyangensis TaxID=288022 RepID=UPI00036D534A|nr:NirD/YgiW/YdeI family stress tolerance protein [Kordiimonas gwangyangensis]
MKRNIVTLAMITAIAGASGAAIADDKNPYADKFEDQSYISLTGTVSGTNGDNFMLDYGDGVITVEMDDWDWYDESQNILTGDRVTVRGEIDDGLYETRSIEASSVFVHSIATTYYANDADEEEILNLRSFAGYPDYPAAVPDGTWITVAGTVTDMDGREFDIQTLNHEIQVDTLSMAYNPLDDNGRQQVEVGDLVYVSGRLDKDFFEQNEIMANTVMTLAEDRGDLNSGS